MVGGGGTGEKLVNTFFLRILLSYSSYSGSSLHEALKQNFKHMGFLFLYQHVPFINVNFIWDTYSTP